MQIGARKMQKVVNRLKRSLSTKGSRMTRRVVKEKNMREAEGWGMKGESGA